MSGYIQKMNAWLINRYPEAWLTRMHYVIPVAGIYFLLGLYAGHRISFFTSEYVLYWLPVIFLILPVILWIRFQYLFFQVHFDPGSLYRIFILNALTGLVLAFLFFWVSFIFEYRVAALKKARDVSRDVVILQVSALYKDSLYHTSDRAGHWRFGDVQAWSVAIDSMTKYLAAVGTNEFSYDVVKARADSISAIYDVPLFKPDTEYVLSYCSEISNLFSKLEMYYPDVKWIKLELMLVFSVGLSILILHVLTIKKIISFLSPFFLSLSIPDTTICMAANRPG